jgi:hypothetical protein
MALHAIYLSTVNQIVDASRSGMIGYEEVALVYFIRVLLG